MFSVISLGEFRQEEERRREAGRRRTRRRLHAALSGDALHVPA